MIKCVWGAMGVDGEGAWVSDLSLGTTTCVEARISPATFPFPLRD